jgi:hypothetical protein
MGGQRTTLAQDAPNATEPTTLSRALAGPPKSTRASQKPVLLLFPDRTNLLAL